MRMRRKKHLTERLEACSSLLISEPARYRGQWLKSFPYSGILLEIGCGKGNFLAGLAPRHPDKLLLGLEKVPDAMVAAMEKIKTAEYQNVFFLDEDAIDLHTFFSPEEIDRIYLNFSTPWLARRHEKRRLTYADFNRQYWEILKNGGEIHLKTDNPDFFAFSQKSLRASGFSLLEITQDLHAQPNDSIITEYESKFMSQGIPICSLIARKDVT